MPEKPTYQKPAVIYAEKVESRAATCAKADAVACAGGPVQS